MPRLRNMAGHSGSSRPHVVSLLGGAAGTHPKFSSEICLSVTYESEILRRVRTSVLRPAYHPPTDRGKVPRQDSIARTLACIPIHRCGNTTELRLSSADHRRCTPDQSSGREGPWFKSGQPDQRTMTSRRVAEIDPRSDVTVGRRRSALHAGSAPEALVGSVSSFSMITSMGCAGSRSKSSSTSRCGHRRRGSRCPPPRSGSGRSPSSSSRRARLARPAGTRGWRRSCPEKTP